MTWILTDVDFRFRPRALRFGHSLSDSGATVIGYELDAVNKLGELKGFGVIEGNVYDIEHLNDLGSFDGLFSGAHLIRETSKIPRPQAYLRALISVVKPRNFSWFAL